MLRSAGVSGVAGSCANAAPIEVLNESIRAAIHRGLFIAYRSFSLWAIISQAYKDKKYLDMHKIATTESATKKGYYRHRRKRRGKIPLLKSSPLRTELIYPLCHHGNYSRNAHNSEDNGTHHNIYEVDDNGRDKCSAPQFQVEYLF